MEKTILSKTVKITSKNQVTIPPIVQKQLNVKEGDRIMFTTDGKNVFVEKEKSEYLKGCNHLQLVTVLRNFLKSGVPLFITGATGTGKTYLTKEVCSYEFDNVVYIDPKIAKFEEYYQKDYTQAKMMLDSLIGEAKQTFTNVNDILVIDEYHYLKQRYNLNINSILNGFEGSLIIVGIHEQDLTEIVQSTTATIHVNTGYSVRDEYEITHSISASETLLKTLIQVHEDTEEAKTLTDTLYSMDYYTNGLNKRSIFSILENSIIHDGLLLLEKANSWDLVLLYHLILESQIKYHEKDFILHNLEEAVEDLKTSHKNANTNDLIYSSFNVVLEKLSSKIGVKFNLNQTSDITLEK